MINLKKSAIESGCSINYQKINSCDINSFNHKSYFVGDIVRYNGNSYYVIENSDVNQNYITLLKKKPLTYYETIKYNNDYDIRNYGDYELRNYDTFGNVKFNEKCGANYSNPICNNYDTSSIKEIVDNWSKDFEVDLIDVDGYKSRLLNVNEMIENLGYERVNFMYGPDGYVQNGLINDWVYDSSYRYWTMTPVEDAKNTTYYVNNSKYVNSRDTYDYFAIRSVINLKKCAISN